MDEHAIASPSPIVKWVNEATSCVAHYAQGMLRVDAVAADILRVRFSPTGRFAASRSWSPLRDLPPAGLLVNESERQLHLGVDGLQATLDLDTGALSFHSVDGTHTFGEDLGAPVWREIARSEIPIDHLPEPELPAGDARTGIVLRKRMAQDEGYFGFGQRTGRLDRRRRRLSHWTVDHSSPGHSRGDDNLYQAHPVFMAVRPGFAWGLYMNSTWYSLFDIGQRYEDVLGMFTLGGELDYFVFAGPTPAAVLEQLTRLTGRPMLPPLWSLGYHQSRWSYGSEAEVRALTQEFRQRSIPIDVVHLDIDYMDDFRVFTWHPERFPQPGALLEELHGMGIHTVTIVDPGVKNDVESDYSVARDGLANEHFLTQADGEPFTGFVWPGESLFPDFCRPETRVWWSKLHASLLDAGVDGIWCDMNEPAIVDRPFHTPDVCEKPVPLSLTQGAADEQVPHVEVHNLYGMLMARSAWEGLKQQRPERRPWILTRSGFVGVQQWAASWMGDNHAWWEHLEMSLPQLASMGLCGSPHVGVDIGGFYQNTYGELYARWMELATFYPFMRCHAHCASRPQEPWSFGPEIETIAREAIELRYRLLPYIYTLAHLAHRRGEPLLRPLLYEFPEAGHLHQIENQVMFGPQLMIAPVVAPGVTRRLVELPPGVWYDFRSGIRLDSGPVIADAPLGRIPIFVRGGSILPLGNIRQSTAEPLTELMLEVYPDEQTMGCWTLIEDAGDGFAFEQGELAETGMRIEGMAHGAVLTLEPRHGNFVPGERDLLLRIHLPEPPAGLTLDGNEAEGWRWDELLHAAEVRIHDDGQAHRLAPSY